MEQYLAIRQQLLSELCIIQSPDRNTGIDCHGGSRSRTLAEDHENGLHMDRSMGNMRGGETNRDKKVLAFIHFRDDGTVRDAIGCRRHPLDRTIAADVSFLVDVILYNM